MTPSSVTWVIAMIFLIISLQFLRFASSGRTTGASFDNRPRFFPPRDTTVEYETTAAPGQASFSEFRALASMLSKLRATSESVVAQEDTLIRMALRPFHSVAPHQHVPSA
jgi:hypothetical protein